MCRQLRSLTQTFTRKVYLHWILLTWTDYIINTSVGRRRHQKKPAKPGRVPIITGQWLLTQTDTHKYLLTYPPIPTADKQTRSRIPYEQFIRTQQSNKALTSAILCALLSCSKFRIAESVFVECRFADMSMAVDGSLFMNTWAMPMTIFANNKHHNGYKTANHQLIFPIFHGLNCEKACSDSFREFRLCLVRFVCVHESQ